MQLFAKSCLAFAMVMLGGPSFAQLASNGCPPDMIHEGFGCRYGDPTGQPQAPRPEEAVDVYVAVASHPDANDVWAIWNVRESQSSQVASNKAVLSDCHKVMGEGCSFIGQGVNSSVAIGRDRRGFIYSTWGETPDNAKIALVDGCAPVSPCAVFNIFTAKP